MSTLESNWLTLSHHIETTNWHDHLMFQFSLYTVVFFQLFDSTSSTVYYAMETCQHNNYQFYSDHHCFVYLVSVINLVSNITPEPKRSWWSFCWGWATKTASSLKLKPLNFQWIITFCLIIFVKDSLFALPCSQLLRYLQWRFLERLVPDERKASTLLPQRENYIFSVNKKKNVSEM